MKPVRCAVAAVLRHPANERLFLAVRRPETDEHLPGVWGLPAVTLEPGELPEQGLRRVGREKLGAEIEPVRFVGVKGRDRGAYELILMDIEARLAAGEPSVATAPTRATRYVDQRWTADLLLLRDAARMGSVCSQVMLDAHGVEY
jgi:ADP-ribose pyrophosphatase YjhB (NUDIX family)